METWFVVIVVTACLLILLNALPIFSKPKPKWPPGPGGSAIVSSIQWLCRSQTEVEATVRSLRARFGPILAIWTLARPLIVVFSHSLAHEALIEKGAVFADRPKTVTNNNMGITSSRYGPVWRLLRRNLTANLLHPSRVKEYSHVRQGVLDILLTRLRDEAVATEGLVEVKEHFQFAIFSLLVLMCFEDNLDETRIREIEVVQRSVSSPRFLVLDYFCPWVTKIVFRNRWNEFHRLSRKQNEILTPLIRARECKAAVVKAEICKHQNGDHSGQSLGGLSSPRVTSYVDTLLRLEIKDENKNNDGNQKTRKLSEQELVSACSEFLTGGSDTTSAALQWIMANLVKYPHIQAKLFEDIKQVMDKNGAEQAYVREDDLLKTPYLKAVILEGLRRHPPAHFTVPHAVTQEVELGGYIIPRNAIVNFMVAEIGWDAEVWEDPMEFKPERFLLHTNKGEFDITGSRELKMMPFGVGRRICPGYKLAMLHLEYFVANLVWNFEWAAVDEVDLSEKLELSTVMKYPLCARISPRHQTCL